MNTLISFLYQVIIGQFMLHAAPKNFVNPFATSSGSAPKMGAGNHKCTVTAIYDDGNVRISNRKGETALIPANKAPAHRRLAYVLADGHRATRKDLVEDIISQITPGETHINVTLVEETGNDGKVYANVASAKVTNLEDASF